MPVLLPTIVPLYLCLSVRGWLETARSHSSRILSRDAVWWTLLGTVDRRGRHLLRRDSRSSLQASKRSSKNTGRALINPVENWYVLALNLHINDRGTGIIENAAWRRCPGVILTNDVDWPIGISCVYAPRLLFFCHWLVLFFLCVVQSLDSERCKEKSARRVYPFDSTRRKNRPNETSNVWLSDRFWLNDYHVGGLDRF